MQAHRLIPHPAHPPLQVSGVEARVRVDDSNWLRLRWKVEGTGKLVLPTVTSKARDDGLWQTTCFEMFLQSGEGTGYTEWNFSPSRHWNAYLFDDYRQGMREAAVERAPEGNISAGSAFTIFDLALPWSELPALPCRLGLTAVIEEEGGRISYWSINHPSEEKPDFHDAACFAAELAAPQAA